ncbi:MAG: AAA family ATPase, partial [Actinomycetota bacterium]|nr:AAA family ATPase [Actinomycetota bacterium]
PNEAGKTSFTSLVRHILYGYPTKTEKERGYHSDSGKREGRLVFSSEEGEWAIERVEGPRGGLVRVDAMRGPERPNLEEAITAGVGKDTFRIVFGFGLDELAAIQSASSGDDVLGKLYSAQVGMQVSPSDVRSGFEKEAQDLWAYRGQRPVLNALKSEIEEVKGRLRELEREATEFAAEREQLDEMTAQLELLRAERAEVATRTNRLATAAERLDAAENLVAENREITAEAEQRLSSIGERLATMPGYENARAVDAELSALLDELSGYRERLVALGERDRELLALRERARSALLESGLDESQAAGVDTGPEMAAGIERWRTQLMTLSAQVESSAREARRARSELEAATEAGAGAVPS